MYLCCVFLCSESEVKALQLSLDPGQKGGKLPGNKESDSKFQLVCTSCATMFMCSTYIATKFKNYILSNLSNDNVARLEIPLHQILKYLIVSTLIQMGP